MERTLFETDITAAVEALREQAGNRWRVPGALLSRSMDYYTQRAPMIREHLNAGASLFWEISPETENVLLEDYARAVFGVYDFNATREQMAHLRGLRSARPYYIDKYGFYYAVLGGYMGVLRGLIDYDRITAPGDKYRGVSSQTDELRAYINGPTRTVEARAVSYLLRYGEFDAGRFAGVSGPGEVNGFLDRAAELAAVYDYTTYYGFCKYCLSATTEELNQIPAPRDRFGEQTPQQFAEQAAEAVRKMLARVGETFAEVLDAPTAEAAEAADEQAKREIIRVPETFAGVLSRDVYGSTKREQVRERDILPIQAFIADYMQRHPDATGTTTPRIVEKTIEGVNMLQRVGNVKPAGGWYTYNTTITEFATLCGYEEPNADQIRAVLLSLLILRDVYLAVWKPDGIHAVNILNVPDIGVSGEATGKIRIQVNTDATKGRPQLLAFSDFKRMREEAKGRAENHFRYQVIAKGHKTENALLDEIFGYTNAIREAEAQHADAETLNGIRRNQQKNKPRDRARLLRMFEREQAAGFLTFRKYKNAKGETVYSWKRTGTDTADTQEPDEQEQPEQ